MRRPRKCVRRDSALDGGRSSRFEALTLRSGAERLLNDGGRADGRKVQQNSRERRMADIVDEISADSAIRGVWRDAVLLAVLLDVRAGIDDPARKIPLGNARNARHRELNRCQDESQEPNKPGIHCLKIVTSG